MSFNVVTGLPRSGSTLMCNLLNQRPDTFASSTSALTQVMAQLSDTLSKSPEETSRMANIPDTAEHHVKIAATLADAWHDTDAEFVFDKGRGWSSRSVLLRSFAPDSGMVVLVRDPREVLASVHRRDVEAGMYSTASPDLFAACSQQMSDGGLIGSAIAGVEDLVRRRLPHVAFVTYDQLAAAPGRAMLDVEAACQMSAFEYNTVDVASTATDLDVLYRNKFPHDSSGPITPRHSGWADVLSDDIAAGCVQRWPLFCRTFGFA